MAWSTLIGHDRWVEAFRDVTRRGRRAHAYLFVGPEGVGKRTFAIELAKSLLCEHPLEVLAACGQCASCLLVDAGTHPDLFVVAKPEDKNVFPIDLMRHLCEGFTLKTARGRGKVAVRDGADDLNDASANCFLKTLEEPPPGSLFILIGTSVDLQMATIRSRCQTIRFAPLSAELVADLLARAALPEPSLAPRLVRLAQGSPGRALALADPELWKFRGRLLESLASSRIDTVGLGKEFVEFAEDAGKETVLHRDRAALTIQLLVAGLRDALTMALGGSATGDDAHVIQPLAQRADPEKLSRLIDRCLEAETQLGRYIQVALVIEGLVDALGRLLEM